MTQVWEAASEKLFFLINVMERHLCVRAASTLWCLDFLIEILDTLHQLRRQSAQLFRV